MLQFVDQARRRRIKEAGRQGRLDKAERKRAVDRTASILKEGQPTRFAFEAACRHGLRAAMCLDGTAWRSADDTAAEIVAEALALNGAERPTWNQGQPWWTDSAATSFLRTVCARCGTGLPEQEPGSGHGQPRKYCSRVCAVTAFNHKDIEAKRAYDRALWHARQVALKAAAPERECDGCGGMHKPVKRPGRPATRFCSESCYQRTRRSWRT